MVVIAQVVSSQTWQTWPHRAGVRIPLGATLLFVLSQIADETILHVMVAQDGAKIFNSKSQ